MVDWFYETSVWITLPIFVGGFVLVSCLIVLAVRPLVRRAIEDTNEWDRTLGHVISTFGVFYGILLALVAVSVYEDFTDTREATVAEAGAIGALYRSTQGLPAETGEQLRNELDAYMRAVIEVDFPDQAAGVLPRTSDVQVDQFAHLLRGLQPETLGDQARFEEAIAGFDQFIESRRARIDATALALPPLFWLVIWVGAAINALLIALIQAKSLRLHLIMAGLLAAFIGLVIFVTADTDRPYAGSISIGPAAYELVLQQIIDARE